MWRLRFNPEVSDDSFNARERHQLGQPFASGLEKRQGVFDLSREVGELRGANLKPNS